jgi:uncharacterized repeat protein (TIGR01451 family)
VSTVSAANEIYVNTTGNDTSGTGTTNNPYLTIQKGLDNIDPNGVIYLADGEYSGVNNTNITINKNMTFIGQSQTNTIINGTNINYIFFIESGITVYINNITFTNGNSNIGGAIYNSGYLTITGCSFSNNTANWYGSAITNEGILTVSDSKFINNTSSGDGGAIANGGIYHSGDLTVNSSTFTNNRANNFSGGAISNYYSTATVTGCTFKNNTASFDGGAISNYYSTATVTGCTFTNNTAAVGGAISNYYSTATVTGCTFTNNSAGDGGATLNYDGTLTVNFCRIVGNSPQAIHNNGGTVVSCEDNWWGSNDPVFSSLLLDVTYPTNWLYMTINATPTTINNTQTSLITVSFNNRCNITGFIPYTPSVGEYIPDGTLVNFQTDLGTIGCKSIDKFTIGGIATAILSASELAGTAHINATTDNQTVYTNVLINPKSSVYLKIIPDKNNPVVGDTVTYRFKVGNNGPDPAENVVMTYTVPDGLVFVSASDNIGNKWTYDPNTRTITWTLGTVPVGDPDLWVSFLYAAAGEYKINPLLITTTYDPDLNANTQSITVHANIAKITSANAATLNTVGMQKTGAPIAGIILAILMVLSGFISTRKKQ